MLRPTTLLLFAALLPISSCILVDPHMDGVIGWTSSEANTIKTFDYPHSHSGCRWFGKAPFCKGKCPKGWTEERSATSRYPSFSLVPTIDWRFGSPCLPSYKKLYCCNVNRMNPAWSGYYVSTQSDRSRYCKYKISANEEKGKVGYYCGSLSCENIKDDIVRHDITVPKMSDYEITGLNCTTLWDETIDATGTASNGTVVWTSAGKVVDRWIKHNLSFFTKVDFDYE